MIEEVRRRIADRGWILIEDRPSGARARRVDDAVRGRMLHHWVNPLGGSAYAVLAAVLAPVVAAAVVPARAPGEPPERVEGTLKLGGRCRGPPAPARDPRTIPASSEGLPVRPHP